MGTQLLSQIREKLESEGELSLLGFHLASFFHRISSDAGEPLLLAIYLTARAMEQGHTCLDLTCEHDIAPSDVSVFDLTSWERELFSSTMVGAPGDDTPFILDGKGRFFFQKYHKYEQIVATDLLQRAHLSRPIPDPAEAASILKSLFPGNSRETDYQQAAALAALLKPLCIVTGGPGTGKTTTIAKILGLLLRVEPEKNRIALAAPTGKGAARMQEALQRAKAFLDMDKKTREYMPEKAFTLHRLLGARQHSFQFAHDEMNPLPLDILVIDESSMIDLALMAKLLQALPLTCRLIILGDKDQLASVEGGAVLGDICHPQSLDAFSPRFHELYKKLCNRSIPAPPLENAELADCIVRLEKNYRFSEHSGINTLCRALQEQNAGKSLEILQSSKYPDVQLHSPSDKQGCPALLQEKVLPVFLTCLETSSPEKALDIFHKFSLLSLVRNGFTGIHSLNKHMTRLLSLRGMIPFSLQDHYPGRPVIITKNKAAIDLYNGDTGILLKDPSRNEQLRAFFYQPEKGIRSVAPSLLPHHETAYAITVHKSQGSEFEEIFLVLPTGDLPTLSRESLYTAVTRARNKITIIGNPDILVKGMARKTRRSTGLGDALWKEFT